MGMILISEEIDFNDALGVQQRLYIMYRKVPGNSETDNGAFVN